MDLMVCEICFMNCIFFKKKTKSPIQLQSKSDKKASATIRCLDHQFKYKHKWAERKRIKEKRHNMKTLTPEQ